MSAGVDPPADAERTRNQEITALRALLKQVPLNLPPLELRPAYDALGARFPIAPDVTLQPVQIAGMQAEWSSAPGADDKRAILYLHGGGFLSGSIVSHRHMVVELGRAAGARTLTINYRLCPENKFPAALEDAVAAYRSLLEAGFAPSAIAIAGDSAAGGLAVAALVAVRDAGLPPPACGVCFSPWVDLEALGATMASKAGEDPMVQREGLLLISKAYLRGADPRNPLASPLHADLRALPPLLVQVGSAEVLLDDAVRLAAAAGAQEVGVQLEVWPEMLHVWQFFHPMLADGRRALVSAGQYIRERMNGSMSQGAHAHAAE